MAKSRTITIILQLFIIEILDSIFNDYNFIYILRVKHVNFRYSGDEPHTGRTVTKSLFIFIINVSIVIIIIFIITY